jgi:flagellar hook-length control protein FliK
MVTYHVMLVEGEPPTVLPSLTEAQHDSSSQRPVVLPNHRTDSTTPLTVEPPPQRMDAPSESNAQSFDLALDGTRRDHIDSQKSITQDLRELTPLALTPLADGANDHQELHTSSPNAIPTVTGTNDGLRSVLRATVTTLSHTRGTVARIVLYPESLGTIVVHLQPQVTGTAVQIVVSSAAALRLVEETIEALRRNLHASGVATNTIAVRMRDDRAAPLHPQQSTTELVLAIGDEHPERRRQRRSFSQRQRQHREHTQFDHFM